MGTLRQGAVVDGRFRLDKRIDSGGFSTVWQATDTAGDTQSTVVVKTPDESVNESLAVSEAFERAQAFIERFGNAIQPTSFARQITAGTLSENDRYVAYEYVPGSTLSAGDIRPGSATAQTIAVRLCHAIAYLHLNDYLYLDLKPENVHLIDGERPVLIDFNTVVPQETGSDLIIRQDGYKPPEQTPAHSDPAQISARSDVYACGATLYRLWTGETPPTERDQLPLTPQSAAQHCAPELATVIEQATEPNPDDRPRDATALLEQLLQAVDAPGYPIGLFDPLTETHIPIQSSTQVGQAVDRGERPDVWFADTEPYVSPVQFKLVRDGAATWRVVDQSTNGTYVEMNGTAEYLLSERGYERKRDHPTASAPTQQPSTETTVADGAVIRPVDQDYHREFVIKRP